MKEFDLAYWYAFANRPRVPWPLEALLILAFLFYPVHFWLAEQIIRRRRGE